MSDDDMTVEDLTPHITAFTRQVELSGKAKTKFRVIDGVVEHYEAAPSAREIKAAAAAALAAERAAEIARPKTGQHIRGHGIFLGTWTPEDREGNSLCKTFNVFAAPTDLQSEFGGKETFKYEDAVWRISCLNGWHGHDGANYMTDKELYSALMNETYNGGWFIPTIDLLVGTNIDGNPVQTDNLYAHKNTKSFVNTFTTSAATEPGRHPKWYWSSTVHRTDPGFVLTTRFTDGHTGTNSRYTSKMSCRPVRLEVRV